MMISKTNDFSERVAIIVGRLNAANFSNCGHWTFRFDDETDELHHAPAGFRNARRPHSLKRGGEAIRAWKNGFHAETVWRSCWSFVSRRASIIPNRVFTTQPPRVTSFEATNRNGPLPGRPA